ncbi:MAG: YbjQ family protein [Gemmatimonadetes bacterium]|nr:YbjQ family protein [Gemmatimonadota bacterium]MBT8461920.1 YbjQ family protein [Gemmatimonadota bacterium]NNK63991.1 heavy metal-binding domain-containing protein [Gemmatimonadota bacterium]
MTTTGFELSGYRIVANLGVVRGVVVRSRSVFGTFGASIQTIFGGNITLFTELAERTRQQAFDTMLVQADVAGADAVVGIRYDATEVMSGVTEVICYGTAVEVVRETDEA